MIDRIGPKQKEILDYLKSEIKSKGYPPSVREICAAVGLRSTSTVHGHLSRLEQKGFIRRDPTKPRAIEVLHVDDGEEDFNPGEIVHVPIVGKVTAGTPILAVENIEDYFPLPISYVKNDEMYMLKVQGNSMINTGIYDGDLIIVRKQSTANNGDIVVALLDDSATVKRFFKEEEFIRLQPENDAMSPIYVREIVILGKVKGVFHAL